MPVFSEKNATLPAFWDERFAQEFTPWDSGAVPQQLRHFSQASAPRRTLIAGCGSAWEVGHLLDAGWDVTAIDFSPQAVKRAQATLGKHAARVQQADFFSFQAAPFELIYERAFLCALPPARWPEIVARWSDMLVDGGLLAGFFFFAETRSGPPFGANPQVLQALLQPHFALLEDAATEDSIEVFAGKERWQIWQKRPQTTGPNRPHPEKPL